MIEFVRNVRDEQERCFYVDWMRDNGIVTRPTAEQLREMNEAYVAHLRRCEQARAGKGFRRPA